MTTFAMENCMQKFEMFNSTSVGRLSIKSAGRSFETTNELVVTPLLFFSPRRSSRRLRVDSFSLFERRFGDRALASCALSRR